MALTTACPASKLGMRESVRDRGALRDCRHMRAVLGQREARRISGDSDLSPSISLSLSLSLPPPPLLCVCIIPCAVCTHHFGAITLTQSIFAANYGHTFRPSYSHSSQYMISLCMLLYLFIMLTLCLCLPVHLFPYCHAGIQ